MKTVRSREPRKIQTRMAASTSGNSTKRARSLVCRSTPLNPASPPPPLITANNRIMNTQARTIETIGDRLISSSAAMQYVMQEVARAAEGSVHVLLSGERGTGRETLARAIHARGRNNEGPFVAIDCAK